MIANIIRMLITANNLEKMLGISVLAVTAWVGWATMHHDLPLALMVVLGQVHGHVSHHTHSAAEEAGHLAVHKKIL